MWSCESCGGEVDGRRILCPACGNGAPGADAEQVRLALQRDVIMEAHVRALGIWYRIGAVMGGVVSLWLLVALGFAVGPRGATASWGGLGMLAGVMVWAGGFLLALSVASYALGHYLSRFVNGARITAGVFAVLGLGLVVLRTIVMVIAINRVDAMMSRYGELAYRAGPSLFGVIAYFVVAGLWSGCVIWALLSRRSAALCTSSYRTLVARTPELTPPTFKSPFFVLPMAATALVFLFAMFVMLPRLSGF